MSRSLQTWGRFLDAALGNLFQPVCFVCSDLSEGASLCDNCEAAYPIEGHVCDRCGDPLAQKMDACGSCLQKGMPTAVKARSLLWLDEGAKRLLHRVKYASSFELLDLF